MCARQPRPRLVLNRTSRIIPITGWAKRLGGYVHQKLRMFHKQTETRAQQ
jgi:hypothetical protein